MIMLDRMIKAMIAIANDRELDTVEAMRSNETGSFDTPVYLINKYKALEECGKDNIRRLTREYSTFDMSAEEFKAWAIEFYGSMMEVFWPLGQFSDDITDFVDYGNKTFLFREWENGTVLLFLLDAERRSAHKVMFFPYIYSKDDKEDIEYAITELNEEYAPGWFEYHVDQECIYYVENMEYFEPSEQIAGEMRIKYQELSDKLIPLVAQYGIHYPLRDKT